MEALISTKIKTNLKLKIMKYLNYFLALSTILITISCEAQWGKTIKGNGNITSEVRNTADYDAISCSGFMDFVLVSGTEGKITIEGEENLLEYIITEVKEQKLIVKVANNTNIKTSRNKTIKNYDSF
jgi:hypothetical protein